MNERIKKIRKFFNLTQQEFSDRLKIKRGTIASYEIGRNEPIDAVISLICREFNVNEAWLRTGEGNMFNKTESSAVERLCTELKASELERQIISAYFKIEPNIRDSFVRRLIHEVEAKRNNDMETTSELTPSMPDVTQDVMSELAEIKRQNQEMAQQNREVVRQNKELLTRLEVLEKEEDEWQREQMKPSIPPTRFHT
ncbi:XRE family transcriptional regulator [bacterium 1XD42-1]|nr:XRE family transcriptional regulator [bacterium 1XD42-8]RKJ61846.1 XRE family transcriptional regulator [bacterium 1XD42-1]